VFPVEAHITARCPSSTALVTATVIPRSLNEPVGLAPSYFRNRGIGSPIRSRKLGAGSRGVFPSSSVTTGVDCDTGRNSR